MFNKISTIMYTKRGTRIVTTRSHAIFGEIILLVDEEQ